MPAEIRNNKFQTAT